MKRIIGILMGAILAFSGCNKTEDFSVLPVVSAKAAVQPARRIPEPSFVTPFNQEIFAKVLGNTGALKSSPEGNGRSDIFSPPSREEIKEKYGDARPSKWGDAFPGITSRISTDKNEIALTFDACGWGAGSGYDEELINFMIKENIPATLFISGKWIEDNPGKVSMLASHPNFEIENHGYLHKPLSVNGRAQFGIGGTKSPEEVYDEISKNAETIYELTGQMPKFFRTGTAFYDDVAVKIALELGEEIAGFSIAGDAGGTLNTSQIKNACKNAGKGDIILFHMNRPGTGINEGVQAVVADLKAKGFQFVLLRDYYGMASVNQ